MTFNRSMVQVSWRDSNGSIKCCYVHDLLHDIAIRKSEEYCFLVVSSNPDGQLKSYSRARRVAIHHEKGDELMKDANPNLRSLFCFNGFPNVSRHRQLKVLSSMDRYWSPSDPKHKISCPLRYLQLASGRYFHASVEIKSMNFLQTLDLYDAIPGELPESIWHIKTLRHILLSCVEYSSGPPSLVEMRNLQTLGGVKPRLSWKDQGLPYLPCLRELHLEVEDGFPWEVVVTFIDTLKHLERLSIQDEEQQEKNEVRSTWKHLHVPDFY